MRKNLSKKNLVNLKEGDPYFWVGEVTASFREQVACKSCKMFVYKKPGRKYIKILRIFILLF